MIDCAISMGSISLNYHRKSYGYYDDRDYTINYGHDHETFYRVPEFERVRKQTRTQKYWEERIRPVSLVPDEDKMILIYEIMKDHTKSVTEDLQMISEILKIASIMHAVRSNAILYEVNKRDGKQFRFIPCTWKGSKLTRI